MSDILLFIESPLWFCILALRRGFCDTTTWHCTLSAVADIRNLAYLFLRMQHKNISGCATSPQQRTRENALLLAPLPRTTYFHGLVRSHTQTARYRVDRKTHGRMKTTDFLFVRVENKRPSTNHGPLQKQRKSGPG